MFNLNISNTKVYVNYFPQKNQQKREHIFNKLSFDANWFWSTYKFWKTRIEIEFLMQKSHVKIEISSFYNNLQAIINDYE